MNIIGLIREELKDKADEKVRLGGERFFREAVCFYGVRNPEVHKISRRTYQEMKSLSKKEIFGLCEELWQSGYMEESIIACNWSHYVQKKYEPGDFALFESWISNYVKNWAACDTFCNHTMGSILMMYPEFVREFKRFAKSENRWMRRAAAVSFIVPVKKGLFTDDILEIADILLEDDDDMVQKGYGWMLKVCSQHSRDLVFQYVMKNKARMPRTALRYAIEKMPEDLRKEAMKKA